MAKAVHVELILFLSRLLTTAETNYWPTELKIAGFVWVIKKARHLVESSLGQVIIQTDHFSILDIIQQSSITSTVSIMQMNVWLIKVSQLLCGFCLSVCHKPRKKHLVSDALSRLASVNANLPQDPNHLEYNVLFAYTATLVQMSLLCLGRLSTAIG